RWAAAGDSAAAASSGEVPAALWAVRSARSLRRRVAGDALEEPRTWRGDIHVGPSGGGGGVVVAIRGRRLRAVVLELTAGRRVPGACARGRRSALGDARIRRNAGAWSLRRPRRRTRNDHRLGGSGRSGYAVSDCAGNRDGDRGDGERGRRARRRLPQE